MFHKGENCPFEAPSDSSSVSTSSFFFSASGQQNLQMSSSSDEDHDSAPSGLKVSPMAAGQNCDIFPPLCVFLNVLIFCLFACGQPCAERDRRKQEKTVAQQAKREQLKRLHRAQVPASLS